MLTVCLIAGCLALGQTDSAPGDSPADAEQAAQVRRLVRQLDAPEKARRDDAEQQLRALGPGVLGLLPQADERLPAEVQLRVRRLRDEFEQAQAEASTQSSHITLDAKGMPLGDVLAALTRQSGNKLVDLRPQFGEAARNEPLNVHFEKTAFWPALDDVLDRAGLAMQTISGEPGIALANRSDTQLDSTGRVSYAGAFRIEATRLTGLRDLRNPSLDSLGLQLEVAWEPRLKPIALFLPSDRIQAVDEHGQKLPLSGAGQELEVNTNNGTYAAMLPINLQLPPRSVTRIARLSGSLRAMVPGRVEDFRFTDLEHAKRTEQRHAGVAVVLDSVHKNNEIWEISIRVKFEKPGQALESHRNWVFNNEAWLESADGDKQAYAGMETTRQSENEVGVAYLFAPSEELAKYTFVYRTPSSIAHITLPFELKDIKLP
ncbi:MAG TPA: hypothetical protein VHV55_18120 [Pirellulales bacterium]|nr:hypothetical protein [Pirellulales bacterium]